VIERLRAAARARPATIRDRLIAGATLLVGGIALFMFLYFPARQERQALRLMADQARGTAAVASHALSAPLLFEDVVAMNGALSSLSQNPRLLYAVVRDMQGSIVAGVGIDAPEPLAGSSVNGAGGGDGADGAFLRDDDILLATAPIVAAGDTIGRVELGITAERRGGRHDRPGRAGHHVRARPRRDRGGATQHRAHHDRRVLRRRGRRVGDRAARDAAAAAHRRRGGADRVR
jgi:hypothetical protein